MKKLGDGHNLLYLPNSHTQSVIVWIVVYVNMIITFFADQSIAEL